MSTTLLFTRIENKQDVYTGKDYMKKFCESLRENATEMNNFKKKKTKSLKNELGNLIRMQKFVIFVKKNLKINTL